MVTLDLVWVSSVEQLRNMGKDLGSLPFLMGIEDIPKVFEICDICIVLSKVPAVELQVTIFLSDHLQQPATLDLLSLPRLRKICHRFTLLLFYHK
jgi:hypothetical protein